MGKKMFDFVIGNPPYQSEKDDNERKPPIYHLFMDACYEVSDKVELITPARFLFEAGQTPKAWNEKMLHDPHLKILSYEQVSSAVFDNTDIKGGVAISYRDKSKNFGAIEAFTSYRELESILHKVINKYSGTFKGLNTIVSNRGLYRFSEEFYVAFPEAKNAVGKGTANMIVSNIFDKLPDVFSEDRIMDGEAVKILGRKNNKRVFLPIEKKYVLDNEYLLTYNVVVPESNGSGAIGEVLSTPLIGHPLIGHTDTFLSIGMFDNYGEANNLLKYIKTKFARCMLGIKKATQHNPASTWKYVPMQDFTDSSDIDWSKSIHEIDLQLYKKYGLDDEEIAFIEEKVEEME